MNHLRKLLKQLLYPFMHGIVSMPGQSHSGALPPMTMLEAEILPNLEMHVRKLAVEIGERSVRTGLAQAACYVKEAFGRLGYKPALHEFKLYGHNYCNIETEITGGQRPEEIVLIGAHYDTQFNTPGADDNASGVAALLEIARLLKDSQPLRTLRLVSFTNEEHPHSVGGRGAMGSWFYARRCHDRRENIVAMLSLEMLGIYSDNEGGQKYPLPFGVFYPTRGDFIAFVGNLSSRQLVHKVIGSFRSHTQFASEGIAAPNFIMDIGRSDHWSFWQFGWQALMVTDTANFRHRLYHTPADTIDKLDFQRFARVTAGLARTVAALAND